MFDFISKPEMTLLEDLQLRLENQRLDLEMFGKELKAFTKEFDELVGPPDVAIVAYLERTWALRDRLRITELNITYLNSSIALLEKKSSESTVALEEMKDRHTWETKEG